MLIDNGSALNVCPLRTATRMGVDPTLFRPSFLIVRAFDNSGERSLERLGEEDLKSVLPILVYVFLAV